MTGILAELRQAHMAAGDYLDAGIKDIDAAFGCRICSETSGFVGRVYEGGEIGGAIGKVAEAIEGDR